MTTSNHGIALLCQNVLSAAAFPGLPATTKMQRDGNEKPRSNTPLFGKRTVEIEVKNEGGNEVDFPSMVRELVNAKENIYLVSRITHQVCKILDTAREKLRSKYGKEQNGYLFVELSEGNNGKLVYRVMFSQTVAGVESGSQQTTEVQGERSFALWGQQTFLRSVAELGFLNRFNVIVDVAENQFCILENKKKTSNWTYKRDLPFQFGLMQCSERNLLRTRWISLERGRGWQSVNTKTMKRRSKQRPILVDTEVLGTLGIQIEPPFEERIFSLHVLGDASAGRKLKATITCTRFFKEGATREGHSKERRLLKPCVLPSVKHTNGGIFLKDTGPVLEVLQELPLHPEAPRCLLGQSILFDSKSWKTTPLENLCELLRSEAKCLKGLFDGSESSSYALVDGKIVDLNMPFSLKRFRDSNVVQLKMFDIQRATNMWHERLKDKAMRVDPVLGKLKKESDHSFSLPTRILGGYDLHTKLLACASLQVLYLKRLFHTACSGVLDTYEMMCTEYRKRLLFLDDANELVRALGQHIERIESLEDLGIEHHEERSASENQLIADQTALARRLFNKILDDGFDFFTLTCFLPPMNDLIKKESVTGFWEVKVRTMQRKLKSIFKLVAPQQAFPRLSFRDLEENSTRRTRSSKDPKIVVFEKHLRVIYSRFAPVLLDGNQARERKLLAIFDAVVATFDQSLSSSTVDAARNAFQSDAQSLKLREAIVKRGINFLEREKHVSKKESAVIILDTNTSQVRVPRTERSEAFEMDLTDLRLSQLLDLKDLLLFSQRCFDGEAAIFQEDGASEIMERASREDGNRDTDFEENENGVESFRSIDISGDGRCCDRSFFAALISSLQKDQVKSLLQALEAPPELSLLDQPELIQFFAHSSHANDFLYTTRKNALSHMKDELDSNENLRETFRVNGLNLEQFKADLLPTRRTFCFPGVLATRYWGNHDLLFSLCLFIDSLQVIPPISLTLFGEPPQLLYPPEFLGGCEDDRTLIMIRHQNNHFDCVDCSELNVAKTQCKTKRGKAKVTERKKPKRPGAKIKFKRTGKVRVTAKKKKSRKVSKSSKRKKIVKRQRHRLSRVRKKEQQQEQYKEEQGKKERTVLVSGVEWGAFLTELQPGVFQLGTIKSSFDSDSNFSFTFPAVLSSMAKKGNKLGELHKEIFAILHRRLKLSVIVEVFKGKELFWKDTDESFISFFDSWYPSFGKLFFQSRVVAKLCACANEEHALPSVAIRQRNDFFSSTFENGLLLSPTAMMTISCENRGRSRPQQGRLPSAFFPITDRTRERSDWISFREREFQSGRDFTSPRDALVHIEQLSFSFAQGIANPEAKKKRMRVSYTTSRFRLSPVELLLPKDKAVSYRGFHVSSSQTAFSNEVDFERFCSTLRIHLSFLANYDINELRIDRCLLRKERQKRNNCRTRQEKLKRRKQRPKEPRKEQQRKLREAQKNHKVTEPPPCCVGTNKPTKFRDWFRSDEVQNWIASNLPRFRGSLWDENGELCIDTLRKRAFQRAFKNLCTRAANHYELAIQTWMDQEGLWTPAPFHVSNSNLGAVGLQGWRNVLQVRKSKTAVQLRKSFFEGTCLENVVCAGQDPGTRQSLTVDLGSSVLILGKSLVTNLERLFLLPARKLQSKVDQLQNRLKKPGLSDAERETLRQEESRYRDKRLALLYRFKVKRQVHFSNIARIVNCLSDVIIAPKLAIKQLIKKESKRVNRLLHHSAPATLYKTQQRLRSRSFARTAVFLGEADEVCSTKFNRECSHVCAVGIRKINHCEKCQTQQARDEGSSTCINMFSVTKPSKRALPEHVLDRLKAFYRLNRYVETRQAHCYHNHDDDSDSSIEESHQPIIDSDDDDDSDSSMSHQPTIESDDDSIALNLNSDHSSHRKTKRKRVPCCPRFSRCLRSACDFCRDIFKRPRISSSSTEWHD